jgi:hypothetical protein
MKLLLNPKVLTFTFEIPAMESTNGVQKILGMAIGLKHHRVDYFPYWHRSNSILLGASAAVDNGAVKLWNYSYVNGKHIQKEIGVYEVGMELDVRLIWENIACIVIEKKGNLITHSVTSQNPPQPLIHIGYLLNSYFETDAPDNKRKPFDVRIWDVRINNKLIEI